MAGLNMGIISALPVRLPPLDQQATIVERFNSLQAECDRLADVQTRKLAALDALKRSLLHQAFTGGLSPQNDRSLHGHGLPLCTQ
jgi:type I restriction enzyme S subunit